MARRRPAPLAAFVLLGTITGCGDRGPSLAERAAASRATEEAAAAKAREESRARAEAERRAALWRYQEATVGGGAQVTAAIVSTDGVDTDGSGAKPVQLVFRDHRTWGRSGYLVLQAGDFACRPGCSISVDRGRRRARAAGGVAADTDEAIALFVRDSARLWRLTAEATWLGVEFPVKAGGTRVARFEVAALDSGEDAGVVDEIAEPQPAPARR